MLVKIRSGLEALVLVIPNQYAMVVGVGMRYFPPTATSASTYSSVSDSPELLVSKSCCPKTIVVRVGGG